MLEVQREGTNRLRVHSHDNEYIGLLRERIARHMGCSAKNVRMICMGEWPRAVCDGATCILASCIVCLAHASCWGMLRRAAGCWDGTACAAMRWRHLHLGTMDCAGTGLGMLRRGAGAGLPVQL
jgi:hypothetical protein